MFSFRLESISVAFLVLHLMGASHSCAEPVKHAAESLKNKQTFLQEKWDSCLRNYAKSVAIKNFDPALIVVRAAFTSCQKREDALFNYFVEELGNAPNSKLREYSLSWLSKTFFPAIKKHNADMVIETVLSTRAK